MLVQVPQERKDVFYVQKIKVKLLINLKDYIGLLVQVPQERKDVFYVQGQRMGTVKHQATLLLNWNNFIEKIQKAYKLARYNWNKLNKTNLNVYCLVVYHMHWYCTNWDWSSKSWDNLQIWSKRQTHIWHLFSKSVFKCERKQDLK